MNTRSNFNANPLLQFKKWYKAAEKSGIKQPDAMTLATTSKKGIPSARIVLFKGLNADGFTFFTNYQSRKAAELDTTQKAALVFYWPLLDQQIRIEGKVQRVSAKESDRYWATRPRESQVGALASKQSSVIPGWEGLRKKIAQLETQYVGQPIPRPSTWGGYCLVPQRIEFWSLGHFRLHDRFSYSKKGSSWKLVQLAP
jgi:pyridoxamine 5'-phosphate oxidase